MDIAREDRLLSMELGTLSKESIRRSQSVEEDDNEPRKLFAFAQVIGARDLLQYLVDSEEWSDFGEFLEAIIETEESRYREAWENDDRQTMIITMAHRRQCSRLVRRLTDPRRRQSLLAQLDSPAECEPSPSQS
ncbi:hypothetical protein E4633_17220 [Geomonas terrae]|uniref:Uncharacterized protein n=1 Tax=Geomonas terrae TaxID=2562681 RepID=A0A4S1CBL8_9BACT|nr:hypothetical protein [Geomonas terrae]TGU70737.1 hypothetical protein E4633_17220 [Geomonas terrae]